MTLCFDRDNESKGSNQESQKLHWKETEKNEAQQVSVKRKRASDDSSISSHHSSPHTKMSPRSPRMSPRTGSPRGAHSPSSSPSISQKQKGAQPKSPHTPPPVEGQPSDWLDTPSSSDPTRPSDMGREHMPPEHGHQHPAMFGHGQRRHPEVGPQTSLLFHPNRPRHQEHGRFSTSALGYPQVRPQPPSLFSHSHPRHTELMRSHSVPSGHVQPRHPEYRQHSPSSVSNMPPRYPDTRRRPPSPPKGFKEMSEKKPEHLSAQPPPPPPSSQEKVHVGSTSCVKLV